MAARIIHLFSRLPRAAQAIYPTPTGPAEPSASAVGPPVGAESLPGTGRNPAFPPVFLIEPLSEPRRNALHELLQGNFDQCFERSDYSVQTRSLVSLHLTVWLVECPTASILTLLDPVSGTELHARLHGGDFPDLDSLLRYLGKLAPATLQDRS